MSDEVELTLADLDELLETADAGGIVPAYMPDVINFRVPERMFADLTDLDSMVRARMLHKFMQSVNFEGFRLQLWTDHATRSRIYRLTRKQPDNPKPPALPPLALPPAPDNVIDI